MSKGSLKFALSPCPNDVFIVSGILLNKVPTSLNWNFTFEDIETLNNWALEGTFDLIKCSFGVWGLIYQRYLLLPVGAALGFGVGPVLVGRERFSKSDFPKLKVGLPGEHTTAHYLFKFYYQGEIKKLFLRYDKIIPALLNGEIDMGVLIHEGRFVYQEKGLVKIEDLGEYWEKHTQAPLPLGGFFLKRELAHLGESVVRDLRASLDWAWDHFDETIPILKKYATELETDVIESHVKTFVTRFTKDLFNEEGLKGLQNFLKVLDINKEVKDLLWRG